MGVQILAMTPVFLSKTLNYICLYSPRSIWVPVKVDVLVIVLAWCTTCLVAKPPYAIQAVHSPESRDGLRNELNGPVHAL